jgi:hypothetical protein
MSELPSFILHLIFIMHNTKINIYQPAVNSVIGKQLPWQI